MTAPIAHTVSTPVESQSPAPRLCSALSLQRVSAVLAGAALLAGCAQTPAPVSDASSSQPPTAPPASAKVVSLNPTSGLPSGIIAAVAPQTDNGSGNGCPTTGRVIYYYPDRNLYASRYYDGASQQESEAGIRTNTPGLCQEIVGREYFSSLLGLFQIRGGAAVYPKPEQLTGPLLRILNTQEPEVSGNLDHRDGSTWCFTISRLKDSSFTIREGTIQQVTTIKVTAAQGSCGDWWRGQADGTVDLQFASLIDKTWLFVAITADSANSFQTPVRATMIVSIDQKTLGRLTPGSFLPNQEVSKMLPAPQP